MDNLRPTEIVVSFSALSRWHEPPTPLPNVKDSHTSLKGKDKDPDKDPTAVLSSSLLDGEWCTDIMKLILLLKVFEMLYTFYPASVNWYLSLVSHGCIWMIICLVMKIRFTLKSGYFHLYLGQRPLRFRKVWCSMYTSVNCFVQVLSVTKSSNQIIQCIGGIFVFSF